MGKRVAAPPKRAKKEKITKKGGSLLKGLLVVLLLLIALAAAVYLFLCARVDQDRILGSVTVGDRQLQGMTLEEARSAVEEYFSSEYQGKPVDILLEGETYTVIPWDDSRNLLSLDVEDQLQKAMEPGHGDFLTRGRDWLEVQLGTESQSMTIAPTLADREGLSQAIQATGIGQVDTAVESSYSVGEDSVSITKGSAGVTADMEHLTDSVAGMINNGYWPAQTQIDCATLESSITELDLQAIYDEVYVEPKDATLDKENDYAIVDSVTGVSFDLEAAQEALDAAEPGSQFTVDLVYTEPNITTQKLKDNLFKDKLSSYSTNVSGSSGRKSNVKLSAQKCDGVILLPGETFSYNDVVGQRTKERGFSEAPAYLNGETIQEVGGGICQTSSTIYAAALYANLEITARTNHTYASSYIGLGLDATVSWGGPEFKFTNDTAYPIKLNCTYSDGRVTATIYGTKTEDITVKITSETLEVIPAKTGEGTHHTGYKVQTYRKLYDGDGNLISSTPEAYSYYKAS
ncbi:MAG: VanW family protein [Candidatus Onthomonas sp.]